MEQEYTISLSDTAAEKIKENFSKLNIKNPSLRIGVKGAGCSGYTYVFKFQDALTTDRDLIFNIKDINIIIDNKSILYLNGTTLDWENKLINHGFIFKNPNEKSSCGCGKSFSV